jgi:hypothetical protein
MHFVANHIVSRIVCVILLAAAACGCDDAGTDLLAGSPGSSADTPAAAAQAGESGRCARPYYYNFSAGSGGDIICLRLAAACDPNDREYERCS